MTLVSNLLIKFAFLMAASHGAMAEMNEPPVQAASMIEFVKPGLLALYDKARF